MKILRISFVIVFIILVLSMSGCADTQQELTVDELISLGEKYLLDLNYEQALVQFNKVIEIEPMNARGYTGAAEAYMGLEKFDEAVAVLQKGLEQTEDDEIRNMLDVLVLNNNEDLNEFDNSNSNEFTPEQDEVIQQLTKALADEDFDTAAEIVGSDTYLQLVEKTQEIGPITHNAQDNNLIIYPIGLVYLGELDNNLRSGLGIWFGCPNEDESYDGMFRYYYKGQWVNDLPNGQGTINMASNENFYLEAEEGFTFVSLYAEVTGTFRDGYFYDGTSSSIQSMSDGEVHQWTETYEHGIVQAIPNTEVYEDDLYVTAICANCGLELLRSHSESSAPVYVFGFEN